MRLDQYLTENNNISRSRAQLVIKKGLVNVNTKTILKPSYDIKEKDVVDMTSDLEFASQGGYKLKLALEKFNIDCTNLTCLDVGASNGGFTNCLLKQNAKKVYALDVAETALPDYLINDEKVVVKERLNARYIDVKDIGEKVDVITIDISFISIKLVLENLKNLLKENGILIGLVKPQFEVGKKSLSKKGIVIDKKIRIKALNDIIEFSKNLGYKFINSIEYNPIDKNKNIEYLIYLANNWFV